MRDNLLKALHTIASSLNPAYQRELFNGFAQLIGNQDAGLTSRVPRGFPDCGSVESKVGAGSSRVLGQGPIPRYPYSGGHRGSGYYQN